jgi:lipoprotein signal peptidase
VIFGTSPAALKALTVTAGLVLLDQISKFAAAHALSGIVVLPRNPAYAFGIVNGSPARLVIVSIAVIVLVLATVGPIAARYDVSPGIPALITAGTLSNTIDRIRLGAVRDFIVTPWGIINIADICVIAGILGLVITLVRSASSYRRAAIQPAVEPNDR